MSQRACSCRQTGVPLSPTACLVWTKRERAGPTETDARNRAPKRASLECCLSRRVSHKPPTAPLEPL
jgi:hypothetical protein